MGVGGPVGQDAVVGGGVRKRRAVASVIEDGGRAGGRSTDRFAVVGVLREVLGVVGVLESAGDGKPWNGPVGVLREGLIGARGEVFAIARQIAEGAGERVGGIEVTIGGGPFVPDAGGENAIGRGLADRADLTILVVSVDLVGGAGQDAADRSRAEGRIDATRGGLDRRSGVPLMILVAVGVWFQIELPAVAEVREKADVLEVRGKMVAVVPVVVGACA